MPNAEFLAGRNLRLRGGQPRRRRGQGRPGRQCPLEETPPVQPADPARFIHEQLPALHVRRHCLSHDHSPSMRSRRFPVRTSRQRLDSEVPVPHGLAVVIVLQADVALERTLFGVGPVEHSLAVDPDRPGLSCHNLVVHPELRVYRFHLTPTRWKCSHTPRITGDVSPVRIAFVGCGNVLIAYASAIEQLRRHGSAELVALCGRERHVKHPRAVCPGLPR